MRPTSVYRYGRWWNVAELNEQREHRALHIINDDMIGAADINGLQSHADGKMYDSKSRYRAELRARGCIEVGNDPQANRIPDQPMPGGWEMDIKRAWEELGGERTQTVRRRRRHG